MKTGKVTFQVDGLDFEQMPMDKLSKYLTAFDVLLGKGKYALVRVGFCELIFEPIQEDAQ